MFLEQFGKFCFSRLRPTFFYFLTLTPIFLSVFYLTVQNSRLNEFQEKFSNACKKGRGALEKKGRKERFLKRHSKADPYFIDRQIESLSFLENEKKELLTLLNHPALSDKRLPQERLDFISSDENRLAFIEETIQTSSQFKETEEKQRHPVQMDEDDLKKLLSLIEDVPIDSYFPSENRPQIIVTELRLEKKETPLKSNVLEVDMLLLKREWIK